MRANSAALSALAQYTGEIYFVFIVYAFCALHLFPASSGLVAFTLNNWFSIITILFVFCDLCYFTECDIRSCLNTLQFLYKKKETLSAVRYILFHLSLWIVLFNPQCSMASVDYIILCYGLFFFNLNAVRLLHDPPL